MPAPAWEDLDEFLRPDEFSVRAQLHFAGGGVSDIPVIFDEAFYDPQVGEYVLESTQPRFMAKEADVASLSRGDVVVIGAHAYDVTRGPLEDGSGMAIVQMARAPE